MPGYDRSTDIHNKTQYQRYQNTYSQQYIRVYKSIFFSDMIHLRGTIEMIQETRCCEIKTQIIWWWEQESIVFLSPELKQSSSSSSSWKLFIFDLFVYPHQNCWAGQCDKNMYRRGEQPMPFYIYFIAQYISSRCAEIRVWFHVPKGPIWKKRDPPPKKKTCNNNNSPIDRSMYNSISVLKWPCLTHGENISGTHFAPDVYGLLFFFFVISIFSYRFSYKFQFQNTKLNSNIWFFIFKNWKCKWYYKTPPVKASVVRRALWCSPPSNGVARPTELQEIRKTQRRRIPFLVPCFLQTQKTILLHSDYKGRRSHPLVYLYSPSSDHLLFSL